MIKRCVVLAAVLACSLRADSIFTSGIVAEDLTDSGETAQANPSLQSVTDAGAVENGFISGSMTITNAGATDPFSVLGWLADCLTGNYLALNFQIPIAALNAGISTATFVSSLLPMDLVDDGNTEIQGSITSYSNVGTPEPRTYALAARGLAALAARKRSLGGKHV